jgi:tetratricopeptide (TPR) repeat protein
MASKPQRYGMRARVCLAAARLAIALPWVVCFGADHPAVFDPADVNALRQNLAKALTTAQALPPPAPAEASAQSLVPLRAIIESAAFSTLDSTTRHTALLVAAQQALRLQQNPLALDLASRASALPDQGVDDWRVRLSASSRLHDAPQEAQALLVIGHQWGQALRSEPESEVLQATRDAMEQHLGAQRMELLQLLYRLRWKRNNGAEPSSLWRDLSLLLIEAGKPDQATEVAAHVSDPQELIAMQADKRFQPVLKSSRVSYVQAIAEADIDQHTASVHQARHSLSGVVSLADVLLTDLRDKEVLDLTSDVIHQVESTGRVAEPAYEDTETELNWIYDRRARALRNLGRYDEAVDSLKLAMSQRAGAPVDHALSLAALLCDLNRPREALGVLPADDKVNEIGRFRVALVRLKSAVLLGDAEETERQLAYMQEHKATSPGNLQLALVVAGRQSEAVSVLLWRLNDPVLRTEALRSVQDFAESPAPARALQWRSGMKALRDRPAVHALIEQLGRIRSYPLRRNPGAEP